MSARSPPAGLLAELTHRCPLACPYCSNPRELVARDAELDTQTWMRVLSEAAGIGVLHVHLSGGEPLARRDLAEIVRHCASIGLYSNLITSGIGLTRERLGALGEAGLDHLQLSIQDTDPDSADRIAGYAGAFAKKREVAGWVTETGLPLTINIVVHRANVARVKEMVTFAIALGARRVEIAHAQYYGWALLNRDMLMPREDDARRAIETIEALRKEHAGAIVIDHVIPDYFARFPKPCMNGWGRRTLNVTPSGRVLPCHAAETIPGLEFWSVRDHSLGDIWDASPAFNAFRGTDWMRAPCATCERRDIDFGGCRCQALALTGDARNTDPVCSRSPHRGIVALAAADAPPGPIEYVYRAMR